MIQDTSASPEVYVKSLEDGSCGGWGIYEQGLRSRGEEQEYPAIDYSNLGERESVWAVTIPGETLWAQDVSDFTSVRCIQLRLARRGSTGPNFRCVSSSLGGDEPS